MEREKGGEKTRVKLQLIHLNICLEIKGLRKNLFMAILNELKKKKLQLSCFESQLASPFLLRQAEPPH